MKNVLLANLEHSFIWPQITRSFWRPYQNISLSFTLKSSKITTNTWLTIRTLWSSEFLGSTNWKFTKTNKKSTQFTSSVWRTFSTKSKLTLNATSLKSMTSRAVFTVEQAQMVASSKTRTGSKGKKKYSYLNSLEMFLRNKLLLIADFSKRIT